MDDTPDKCIGNLVRGNTITTNGNECVDIKEGSTDNIVEKNVCSNQLDENSGCFDSRGDNNIIGWFRICLECLFDGFCYMTMFFLQRNIIVHMLYALNKYDMKRLKRV